MNNLNSQPSILIVDDEEKVRKYFCKGLEKDFNIFQAKDVLMAKQIIENNEDKIGVVIADQRMPGGNGTNLLNFLRKKYPNIIRLITSAYSDIDDAIEAINKGEIYRYIQKPWDYNILRLELKQALELFETRKQKSMLLQEKILIKESINRQLRVHSLKIIETIFDFEEPEQEIISNMIKSMTHNEANTYIQEETQFIIKLINKIKINPNNKKLIKNISKIK